MARLKGRTSKTTAQSAAYRASLRAKRREAFQSARAAVRAQAPPPVLGKRTDILIVLAAAGGPVRRVALEKLFGEIRVGEERKGEGFCVGWNLPSGPHRGQRGTALALDPYHPLFNEARALLLVLAQQYLVRAEDDLIEGERAVPHVERDYDLERIIGSQHRLHVLATLESFGGTAAYAKLIGACQGMGDVVLQDVLKRCKRDGFVAISGRTITFAAQPWMHRFRAFLRAYLRAAPAFVEQIKASKARYVRAGRQRWHYTLFGRAALNRVLGVLAVHGPLRLRDLLARSGSRTPPVGISDLLRVGVLAKKTERGGRGGRKGGTHDIYGLNGQHPLYREMLALFASYGDGKASTAEPVCAPVANASISKLFTSPLFFNVLLAIETAVNEWIDPATIGRFYAQHDRQLIMRRLREWSTGKDALLERQRPGFVTLYRFNPTYPQYQELRTLLSRVADMEPRRRTLAGLESISYRSTVQQTAHKRLRERRKDAGARG